MNYIDFSDEYELKNYINILEDLEPNDDLVSKANQMAVHLKGEKPENLLEDYRPNEHPDIRAYRLQIYEPTTKSDGERISNTLSKVQRQSQYSVDIETQSGVIETETLNAYVNDYPFFGDLSKWVFDSALEYSLIDANALVCFFPMDFPETDTSYYKPVGHIFPSHMVIDEGINYYTIKLEEKNVVKDEKTGAKKEYDVYLLITNESIKRIKQVKREEYEIEELFKYTFDRVPAYKLGGKVISGDFPIRYESFISGILPYWNKAVRLDSDLDAQYVQHMYLERVEMETECSAGCHKNEAGKHIRLINDKEVVCSDCKGTGWITGRTPYGTTSVKKDDFEANNTIFPGVQYIEKNTEIVDKVEDKIDKLISKGFAAINLDVLDKVGDNQSGIAKVIDRDALNSFFSRVSNNLYDNIYWNALELISLWRYETIVPFTINKPVNFDYSSIESITDDLKTLRDSGASPHVIALTEKDLIGKKYFGEKNKISNDVIDLDPYYGKNEEDKANMLLAGGASRVDYIISSNIYQFIMRAYSENKDFYSLDRSKKVETLKKYANELIQERKKDSTVEIQPDGQGN